MGTVGGSTLVRATALTVLVGLLAGPGARMSLALWSATRTVGGNTMTTAAKFDTIAPSISGSVIAKASGTGKYLAGSIRPGSSFFVYANVTDSGAGASGVATVTANVSSIRAGATATALVAGTYSVEGVAYAYRSAAQTATATTAQTYAYSITATDKAGNVATNTSFSVVVDGTAPAGSDVQTTNGGTAGRPDTGDTVTVSYTERIDPESVLAGWTGASTAITVRFTNSGNNDSVAVWNGTNSAQLPLGSVALNGNFVSANTTFAGTMLQSGTTITVTLGTMSSGAALTSTTANAMSWTPSASAKDAAGNACSTASRPETGTSDVDF